MTTSPNCSMRSGTPVRLVAIHSAEGARTAASLGSYFADPGVQASSHVGIDDAVVEQYVPYSMAAWTMLSANSIADQAELCGFAAWTRDEWVGQHHRMLELTAAWIRNRCLVRGIPIVKLTPAQVAAGQAGVCGHVDWTLGMHDGTHTDPGPGFPWDVVMALAQLEDDVAWSDPLPDLYPGAPKRTIDAGTQLAFANAHAAQALDAANQAKAEIAAVAVQVAAIARKLGV